MSWNVSSSEEKEKRRQRRDRNVIARDLATPKYHQRVIQRKRVEDEDGNIHHDYYEVEPE